MYSDEESINRELNDISYDILIDSYSEFIIIKHLVTERQSLEVMINHYHS